MTHVNINMASHLLPCARRRWDRGNPFHFPASLSFWYYLFLSSFGCDIGSRLSYHNRSLLYNQEILRTYLLLICIGCLSCNRMWTEYQIIQRVLGKCTTSNKTLFKRPWRVLSHLGHWMTNLRLINLFNIYGFSGPRGSLEIIEKHKNTK